MKKIINEVKKNRKPLIIGGLLGLLIGVYGANHYYQSEYAKLTAFTSIFGLGDMANKVRGNDKEDMDQVIKHIKSIKDAINDGVINKLNKIDVKLSEVAINNQNNSKGIMAAIEGYYAAREECNCNKTRDMGEGEEESQKNLKEDNKKSAE